MRYLNERHIREIGIDWHEINDSIVDAVQSYRNNDYVQPLKPYLRFNDLTNRIIAMPGYVGGNVRTAGLKWIASFPNNTSSGLPRAHSVTILNNAENGEPVCMINSALVSGLRTAGVSGLFTKKFLTWANKKNLKVSICGFGVIGQLHLQMMLACFSPVIDSIRLFDVKGVHHKDIAHFGSGQISVCGSWQEAYEDADIFITCTVSAKPYIDLPPKKGSLHLNVSLRDYQASCIDYMDIVVVDEWKEVCRENTDIERMHKERGLTENDTLNFADVVLSDALTDKTGEDLTVMFNPMGMAIFDIALGTYYYRKSEQQDVGLSLEN